MSNNILPECHADTLLVEILGYERPNHCASIGQVARAMESNYKNKVAVGVIDKDKPGTEPTYFRKFELLVEKGGLELKWYPATKHFIVIVDPVLEQWLIDTANKLGVPLDRYKFDNLKKLKRVTKSQDAADNQNLKDFLNTLKQKKGSPLKSMIEWIDLVLEKNGKIAAIKRALDIDE